MRLLRKLLPMLAAAIALFAGQAAAQDPRLERLDAETRPVVAMLVDSARDAGLPTEPLIQRALEGVTKGAPSARIIGAVRRLAADLGAVRVALGAEASVPELEAGVAALRAGATRSLLEQLRELRRPPRTMALALLADLVARGVPPDTAAAAVLALAPSARDGDLVEFRRAVERDIALGASPAAATTVRLSGAAEVNAGARISRPGRP